MDWMVLPLKRYADFSGRSRRMEYWMFILLQMIIYFSIIVVGVLFGMIFSATGGSDDGVAGVVGVIMAILFVLVAFGLFIPSLAVMVRRFHDQDHSGWMILLQFVPFGAFVILVFMCLEGTRGPNRYGEDPKGAAAYDVFA